MTKQREATTSQIGYEPDEPTQASIEAGKEVFRAFFPDEEEATPNAITEQFCRAMFKALVKAKRRA